MPSPDVHLDVIVYGGALVEQVVYVPRLPKPNQDNVSLSEMSILPGGSGANVAVYLARLGNTVQLIDKWGDDEHADFLEKHLSAEKVDLSLCRRLAGIPTPFMIILALPDADWSGIIRVPPKTFLEEGDLTLQDLSPCRILHFHGFCMGTPEAIAGVGRAIDIAQGLGVTVTMDASTPLAMHHPEVLHRFLPACDIFFANHIEAEALTKEKEPHAILKALLEAGAGAVVLKAGERGCYASDGSITGYFPAFPVRVVDTIGAGDGVVAGTLSGLCKGLAFSEAVRLGVATAALVCRGIGAQSRRFTSEEAFVLGGL